jgi:hypothetical protein
LRQADDTIEIRFEMKADEESSHLSLFLPFDQRISYQPPEMEIEGASFDINDERREDDSRTTALTTQGGNINWINRRKKRASSFPGLILTDVLFSHAKHVGLPMKEEEVQISVLVISI